MLKKMLSLFLVVIAVVLSCRVQVNATKMSVLGVNVDSQFKLCFDAKKINYIKFYKKMANSGTYEFAKLVRTYGVYKYYSSDEDLLIYMILSHLDSSRYESSQSYNVPYDKFRHKSMRQSIDFSMDEDFINSGDFANGAYSPITNTQTCTSSSGWGFGIELGGSSTGPSGSFSVNFSNSISTTYDNISHIIGTLNEYGRVWDFVVANYQKNDNHEAKSAFSSLVMSTLSIEHASKYVGETIQLILGYNVDYYIDETLWEDYNVSTSSSPNNLNLNINKKIKISL